MINLPAELGWISENLPLSPRQVSTILALNPESSIVFHCLDKDERFSLTYPQHWGQVLSRVGQAPSLLNSVQMARVQKIGGLSTPSPDIFPNIWEDPDMSPNVSKSLLTCGSSN